MGLAEEEHIVIHGYIEDDQGQTWCEMDDAELTGYTVYRRIPLPDDAIDGAFDLVDEKDFLVLTDAEAYAAELSAGALKIFIDY